MSEARIVWEPPNRTLAKNLQPVGLYHAAPTEDVEDGLMPRLADRPLCNYDGTVRQPEASLLPPAVTCSLCVHHMRRLGITIADPEDPAPPVTPALAGPTKGTTNA